jgi:hypothetical protein
MAALAGGGMEPQRVDIAGALAMTTAAGVPGDIAAALLRACADGIARGQAERRARE